MTKEEVLDYIRANVATMSWPEMGRALGLSADTVRGRARRAGIEKPSTRVTKRTTESYNLELKEKGSSFVLLEPFTKVGDYLLHRCTKCGIEDKRRPQDILRTPNCSKCSSKIMNVNRKPLDQMLAELPSKFTYVSGYEGYATKCTFYCKECSNVWQVQPGRLISSGVGCPSCKNIATGDRCRRTLKEIQEKCEALGLEFLDKEYISNKEDHLLRNKTCGHVFTYKLNHIKQGTCRVCSSELKRSRSEREVQAFIESLGFTTARGRLENGQEIDIVVQGTNIGIEFNGQYWHSEKAGKTPLYHLAKTKMFDGRLIHVFEFMWESKKELIKSMLRHALGRTERKVYARNCQVRELSAKDVREFLDSNHIQGFLAANKYYGLVSRDSELLAVMTINKSRFNSDYQYEIGRYAVLQNTSVVGGASKLFSVFVRECAPKSVVSYCHRFYSQGDLYTSLGMSLSGVTKPGYWYLHPDGKTVSSRQKFQKHKLKGLLPSYDENKTEAENMEAAGYSRIYDCGNLVFVWKPKQEK